MKNQLIQIFSENLKYYREQKGLSIRQLQKLSRVDHSNISQIENKGLNVTLETIAKLAKALDTPAWTLLVKTNF